MKMSAKFIKYANLNVLNFLFYCRYNNFFFVNKIFSPKLFLSYFSIFKKLLPSLFLLLSWAKSRVLYYANNWIYTTNHKRIAINYFWFVILSGIFGMVLATVIRLELAYPGVGIFAGDSLQYLSLATAHGVIMVFFMIIPLLSGAFANFLLPTQLGVHDVAFPRLNSAAFWFLPGGLVMLGQLICLDRRYQRMNCFNIREVQSLLKRRFFFDLINSNDHHLLLDKTMIGVRYKTSDLNAINHNLFIHNNFGLQLLKQTRNFSLKDTFSFNNNTPLFVDSSYLFFWINKFNNNGWLSYFFLLIGKTYIFFFSLKSNTWNYFFSSLHANLILLYSNFYFYLWSFYINFFNFFFNFNLITVFFEFFKTKFFIFFNFIYNYTFGFFLEQFKNFFLFIFKNFDLELFSLVINDFSLLILSFYIYDLRVIEDEYEATTLFMPRFLSHLNWDKLYIYLCATPAVIRKVLFPKSLPSAIRSDLNLGSSFISFVINHFLYFFVLIYNNIFQMLSYVHLKITGFPSIDLSLPPFNGRLITFEIWYLIIRPLVNLSNSRSFFFTAIKEFFLSSQAVIFNSFLYVPATFEIFKSPLIFANLHKDWFDFLKFWYFSIFSCFSFTNIFYFKYFFSFTVDLNDLRSKSLVIFSRIIEILIYFSSSLALNLISVLGLSFFLDEKETFLPVFVFICNLLWTFLSYFTFSNFCSVFVSFYYFSGLHKFYTFFYNFFTTSKDSPISNYSAYFFDLTSLIILNSFNSESMNQVRGIRSNSPIFSYDYRTGNYFPKFYQENFTHMLSTLSNLTGGVRTSAWFLSENVSDILKADLVTFFNEKLLKFIELRYKVSKLAHNRYLPSDIFYNLFLSLTSNNKLNSSCWSSFSILNQKFSNMFLTSSMQQRVYSNWRQLKFTREAWRCKLLSGRHQKSLFRRYVHETGVFWSIERNARDLLPGWAMITPFSSRTRFTAIGKVDIGVSAILLVLISSIISSVNFLVTYRYLSTLNNRKMRDARSFFTEGIMCSAWMMIAANPMLIIGLIMLLSDRHWQTSFFDYSGGGDTILFQHMFWFFGHPEVYIVIIPTFGFVNTLFSYYLKKRISARASLLYSIYTIAFLGFFVWGHHMYMVGLSHTTRMLFSTLTVMISVPAATKLMHWCVTLVNSSFTLELPFLFMLTYVFLFVSGGISGMCVAHTGMDVLFHDTFYVIGHFHVMFAGAAMFGSFGAFYFYFPSIFGVKYSRIYAYLHFTYYLLGQLLTVIPMFWLGYAGMPRRVLDYPSAFGGWHSIITAGHMLSVAGLISFFIMIFDSMRQSKAATRNNFGIMRYNTRLNFYLYEISRVTFVQQKGLHLYRYYRPTSFKLNGYYYSNYEFLETTLFSYTLIRKKRI